MFRELKRFMSDESGGIVDQIVGIALVIIIAGGILVVLLGGLQGVSDAIMQWFRDNIPGYAG